MRMTDKLNQKNLSQIINIMTQKNNNRYYELKGVYFNKIKNQFYVNTMFTFTIKKYKLQI